jgi:hypothetical protein
MLIFIIWNVVPQLLIQVNFSMWNVVPQLLIRVQFYYMKCSVSVIDSGPFLLHGMQSLGY